MEKIISTEYSEEMQRSYIDYSMSVITARAIPDARDGLKPVQRRVLYDMSQLRLDYDKPHRKSARIVGDTMGKYHPHGDSSIYDTLVVMSQGFKKGMPLVDGHGNFGSIEGDGAAAMRYTEARLQKFTQEVFLKDLDKTVNFIPNYDETEREPEVLPVRVPNLLINGSEGIAVGMSTSIPPHNVGEVIDTAIAYIRDRKLSNMKLLSILHGPDFPTGGIIANASDLATIYETGAGKIKLRARIELEPGKKKSDRDKLVITEIPYTMIGSGINKCLSDIADLAESRKLPDITDISNQSGKEGIRIVLELKKGADAEKIKAILYKKTKLEDTFGVNMLAIVKGRPETLSLRGILENYLEFQYENNTRKYDLLLKKELENKEIKEGLIDACDCIDVIIAILRGSRSLKDAKLALTCGDISHIHFRTPGFEEDAKKLHFTERQADAILEMRLYRLIGLEIQALQKEYLDCVKRIREYKQILASRDRMNDLIIEDLEKIKKEFSDPRRTLIEDSEIREPEEEPEEAREAVFLLDRFGYCKLADPAVFEKNKETLFPENGYAIPCRTDGKISLFTDAGNLHQVKVSDIPFGKAKDKGVPVDNLSKLDGTKERPVLVEESGAVAAGRFLFVTGKAMVKIVAGTEFVTNNRLVAATRLSEGDRVFAVLPLSGGEKEIVLQTNEGVFLKFSMEEIPEMKKNSVGVRGMKLAEGEGLYAVHLLSDDGSDPTAQFKNKVVHLSRLRLAKRDGRGSKVRV